MKIIRQTSGLSMAPQIGGNIAKPKAPAAICIPTSLLPVDVSLVAMTVAAANKAAHAAGNISAIDRINKYNQKLKLLFIHSDSCKILPVELYPLYISHFTIGRQEGSLFVKFFSIAYGILQ